MPIEKPAKERNPLLEMKDISKSFGAVPVLKGVSLSIESGEVHALMGENGAGKSTLMKILAGIHLRDGGVVRLKNQPVHFRSPAEALQAGISMIHQELNHVADMSVAANIFLGREPSNFLGIIRNREILEKTKDLLERFAIRVSPTALMRYLSVADQQMIEIVKAIHQESTIIIMDEPSSALSSPEIEKLFSVILDLKMKGVSTIYISHRMKEIFSISDQISVLRDGQLIQSKPAVSFSRDSLITAMVGRLITEIYPAVKSPSKEEVLFIKNFSHREKFKEISLKLYKGEILGLAGLMGAGRTELLESIFGITLPEAGQIFIHKERISIRSPRDAIKSGMAFVSEDRKLKGLYLDGSVRNNMSLVNLKNFCLYSQVISLGREKTAVKEMMGRLQIKSSGYRQPVNNLSGGNQQKVVLGKWLLSDFEILLLDEPTRGIDVGAKAAIYQLISDLASRGKAIILISSEMSDLIGLCHRIMVMCEGRITDEIKRPEFTQEKIMTAALPSKRSFNETKVI